MILERPDEREGPGDVVVGDDERGVQPLVDIILDRSEFADDALIGPPLERAAKINADQLAKHRRISALAIIWEAGRAFQFA